MGDNKEIADMPILKNPTKITGFELDYLVWLL